MALPLPEMSPAVVVANIEDRYELHDDEEKGKGAFSRVVIGVDRRTGQKRAVKIMEKAGLVGKKAEMVQHEKEILRRLKHPSIIRLHECVETPQRIYMVLDLMDTDLFEYIVKCKKLSEQDAAMVMRQLLEAVQFLHAHSVVHRDIKPENILINDPSNVKLADFGLAKLVQDDDVKSTPCGTSFYIAPEIIRGIEQNGARPLITTREEVKFVDMWSLGVVLYILLSGRPPFTGQVKSGTDRRALLAKIDRGVLFPDAHWANISENAKDLVMHLLAQDTKERFTADKALRHPFVTTRQSLDPLSTPSVMQGVQKDLFQEDINAIQEALLAAGDAEGETSTYSAPTIPVKPAGSGLKMGALPKKGKVVSPGAATSPAGATTPSTAQKTESPPPAPETHPDPPASQPVPDAAL